MQTLSATDLLDIRKALAAPRFPRGFYATQQRLISLPPDFLSGLVVRRRIAQAKRRLNQLYAAVDNWPPNEEGSRQA